MKENLNLPRSFSYMRARSRAKGGTPRVARLACNYQGSFFPESTVTKPPNLKIAFDRNFQRFDLLVIMLRLLDLHVLTR